MTPNALGVGTESVGNLPEIPNALGIATQPKTNLVVSLGQTLKELAGIGSISATSSDDVRIKPEWRVEKRNDRDPIGYAIFQRGKNGQYVGYVGANSPVKKGLPSYSTIKKGQKNNGKN